MANQLTVEEQEAIRALVVNDNHSSPLMTIKIPHSAFFSTCM